MVLGPFGSRTQGRMFRPAHGRMGMLLKRHWVLPMLRVQTDPDAQFSDQFVPLHSNWTAQGFNDVLCNRKTINAFCDPRNRERKFRPAHASRGVAFFQKALETVRGLDCLRTRSACSHGALKP
jgi:hypothetical protein